MMFKIFNKGVAFLPTVLLFGGLLTATALGTSLIVYLLYGNTLSVRSGMTAATAARTGLQDAFLRIVRDINLGNVSYVLVVGDGATAAVTVTTLSSVNPAIIRKQIISIGSILNRYRQLRATAEIDKNTGELRLICTEEFAVGATTFSCN